jgi:TPR repeat protein
MRLSPLPIGTLPCAVLQLSLILPRAGGQIRPEPKSLIGAACSVPSPNVRRQPTTPEQPPAELLEQRYLAGVASPDLTQQVREIQRAAEVGDANAQYNAGVAYLRGIGVQKDASQALRWFRKAAQQGHERASHQLGALYLMGDAVPRDDVAALTWFRISTALDNDDTEALALIAEALSSILTAEQLAEASGESVEWFRSHISNPKFAYALGRSYSLGDGVQKNEQEAFRWYLAAAKAGYPRADVSVGDSYVLGEGVEKSRSEAANWFRRAAESSQRDGQRMLALVCREENEGAALAWLQLAAESGSAEAMHTLATWEAEPLDVKWRNPAEALAFAIAAVDTQSANAEYLATLAKLYQTNQNTRMAIKTQRQLVTVTPDDPVALNRLAWWYLTAADAKLQDVPEALRLAQHAVELTNQQDEYYLDTLAEAYFAKGDFNTAVDLERKAVRLKSSAEDFKKHLDKYLDAQQRENR